MNIRCALPDGKPCAACEMGLHNVDIQTAQIVPVNNHTQNEFIKKSLASIRLLEGLYSVSSNY